METAWVLVVCCVVCGDMWLEVALSWNAAIAPEEITKNAMEMPMVRLRSIRRVSFLLHIPARRRTVALPAQWYWNSLGDADRCRPGLLGCIRVGPGGTAQAKQRKTQMSTPSAALAVSHGFPECRRLSWAPL